MFNMTNQKAYVFQISTNPISESKSQLIPYDDYEESFSFSFIGDFSMVTGMNNSLEKTIEAIKNSSLVYMIHGLDFTSYFELGLAISLGKKIYYVTEQKHDKFNFQLPYNLENLIPITYEEFNKLVDDL